MKTNQVVIASDHAGFQLKENIKKFLIKKRKRVFDLGTNDTNSVDYTKYAHMLSKKMICLLSILNLMIQPIALILLV